MSALLHAIGAGPGDPELITAKGLRLLRAASTVFLPATRAGHSYAGSIVAPYLHAGRQQIVELLCPPYRGRALIEARWEELAGTVAAHLLPDRVGAFVCEGDPSLYSTFLHLRRGLERLHPEIEIAVVPGVTSVSASAAVAGFPLASWDERLLITPGVHAADSLAKLLETAEALALLKPGPALARILSELEQQTPPPRIALVRRAGRPEQTVLDDPAAMRLAGDDYFTTVLLKRASPGGMSE